MPRVKALVNPICMPDLYRCRKLGYLALCLFAVCRLHAQQTDTTVVRTLSDIEVVEKARPSVTRQGAPLQIMGHTEIARLGLQDVSEAVKRFSGVTVKDYGGIGGLKTVSVRGLGAQHTAVSYDGITITNAESGQVDISRFTLDNVENVSLSIGQADNIFQTARMFASAGALQIQTAKPLFTNSSFHTRVRLKGGSFGLFNPTVYYAQKLGKLFAASLHGEWQSAKGDYPFTLTNGNLVSSEKRRNSDTQSLRLEGNLYGDFGTGGNLQVKVYYFDSERGLPGSVVLYNDYARERLWDRNYFAQLRYENRLNELLTLQLQAKYNYSYSKYRDIDPKYPDGIQEDRNTQEEYYLSAGLLYAPHRYFSASLVSDIAYNNLDNNFQNNLEPERWTSQSVLAAQYKRSQLTATASLLATYMTDRVKQGEAPADRKRLSPAISVTLRPFATHNLRLRLSWQDVFRTPTFTDLYYTRMGNTKLRPEKARQWNAGITWSGTWGERISHLHLSADAFYNRVSDKIVAIPTMYLWKMMNTGEVDIRGIDCKGGMDIVLTSKLQLGVRAGYTWQRAIDITDPAGKTYRHQLPYTPEHTGNVSLSFENPWVNIAWNMTGVNKRYSLAQNIEANRIPGYMEHGLSLNREFALRKGVVRLQGEVINLGDKTYDVIRYYPMPGRSWRLSISFNY